jgi:hypothetical protein
MVAPRVWWTIPGSDVAWEWLPDAPVVRTGRLVTGGGASRFHGDQEWAPMWTSARTRAGFQALKDLTALFAEECNVVPGAVRVFWIAGERAVSWSRATGRLFRHEVIGPGAAAEMGAVLAGRPDGTAADLRTADAHAQAVLSG